MKLSDLRRSVTAAEARLAPGSKTPLLGHWLERMRQLTGVVPRGAPGEYAAIEVPDREDIWWARAYELYEAHGDEYDDIQELFDAVKA